MMLIGFLFVVSVIAGIRSCRRWRSLRHQLAIVDDAALESPSLQDRTSPAEEGALVCPPAAVLRAISRSEERRRGLCP
jgi:hypothetical protein